MAVPVLKAVLPRSRRRSRRGSVAGPETPSRAIGAEAVKYGPVAILPAAQDQAFGLDHRGRSSRYTTIGRRDRPRHSGDGGNRDRHDAPCPARHQAGSGVGRGGRSCRRKGSPSPRRRSSRSILLADPPADLRNPLHRRAGIVVGHADAASDQRATRAQFGGPIAMAMALLVIRRSASHRSPPAGGRRPDARSCVLTNASSAGRSRSARQALGLITGPLHQDHRPGARDWKSRSARRGPCWHCRSACGDVRYWPSPRRGWPRPPRGRCPAPNSLADPPADLELLGHRRARMATDPHAAHAGKRAAVAELDCPHAVPVQCLLGNLLVEDRVVLRLGHRVRRNAPSSQAC
jgi:hypothetical protein